MYNFNAFSSLQDEIANDTFLSASFKTRVSSTYTILYGEPNERFGTKGNAGFFDYITLGIGQLPLYLANFFVDVLTDEKAKSYKRGLAGVGAFFAVPIAFLLLFVRIVVSAVITVALTPILALTHLAINFGRAIFATKKRAPLTPTQNQDSVIQIDVNQPAAAPKMHLSVANMYELPRGQKPSVVDDASDVASYAL